MYITWILPIMTKNKNQHKLKNTMKINQMITNGLTETINLYLISSFIYIQQ